MAGFGGFGTAPTGGGLFGDKPPDQQSSSGFTMPTTTVVTTTTGLTFGTPTFGTGGTGLFGAQQQTSSFDSTFGSKPAVAGTGFTFNPTTTNTNTPTFGAAASNVTAPTFGVTPNTTTSGFNISTPGSTSTTLPTFGSFGTSNPSTFGSLGTTNISTFGSTSLSVTTPKTSGITGFTVPAISTTVPTTFGFGLTTSAPTSNTLTFGVQTTASTTTAASTAPTLSFGISTAAATTSAQPTGFTLGQQTTTSSLTFGAPKTSKTLTFGTGTTGFGISAATATPSFNLATVTTTAPTSGTGLFGTPKTTELGLGTTTVSAGLGGVDNKQTTQGLSGTGSLEPKHVKDHLLPEPILQTLNEFQNFTKQQKSLSVEISHGSSKPLKKVQEDTEALESLLTMITSGLTRNAIAVDKLKTETAQGLHQAEMAQRNHENPPGLDYDTSAPSDYFNDLVTKFEADTVRLRVQIEASEKHLRSLTQSSIISPQELTLAMRRLHETLIVLAARVQALHTSVQSQKEQFKNLRRVYFKDDTNVFENDSDQNVVKKQTIYSLRSLTGPTPFSEHPASGPLLNVDGLAMLAGSTGASIPSTSANPSKI